MKIDPEEFLDALGDIGPTISTRESFTARERLYLNFACMICWWLYHHEPARLAGVIAALNCELKHLRETPQ